MAKRACATRAEREAVPVSGQRISKAPGAGEPDGVLFATLRGERALDVRAQAKVELHIDTRGQGPSDARGNVDVVLDNQVGVQVTLGSPGLALAGQRATGNLREVVAVGGELIVYQTIAWP